MIWQTIPIVLLFKYILYIKNKKTRKFFKLFFGLSLLKPNKNEKCYTEYII